MPVLRRLILVLAASLLAAPVLAAELPPHACLSKAEQRVAVSEHRAIPLAEAVKILRTHGHRGELVRARLCHNGEKLAYVLTLLPRSGKVTRLTVDAANGEVINGR